MNDGFCTITVSTVNFKKIEVNFYGDKEFMINCIFNLVKLYKEEFEND